MTTSPVAGLSELAPELLQLVPRQLMEAFVQYPDVVMAFTSMGLAAALIAAFWLFRGTMQASQSAGVVLRAQALKRVKDHRALVLIGFIDGGPVGLRAELKRAIEDHFGLFAFQAEAVVELFPI